MFEIARVDCIYVYITSKKFVYFLSIGTDRSGQNSADPDQIAPDGAI